MAGSSTESRVERISLSIPRESAYDQYDIVIGSGVLANIAELGSFDSYTHVLFVIDQNVRSVAEMTIRSLLNEHCTAHYMTSSEGKKDFSYLTEFLNVLLKHKLDRQSLIVTIGGGMLGDFVGFAASIYMRGINFIQVPSTLLAQVDASVGGKVAINFAGLKNMIGAFQQPKLVVVDISLLNTLPKRELYAGYAEIIKHAIVYDLKFFNVLESTYPDLLTGYNLTQVICRSLEIKADIVENDPLERNIRKILNFGHTIGHAIEALAAEKSSPLFHGEAVALGMIAEAEIARSRGTFSQKDLDRIRTILGNYYLPTTHIAALSENILIEKMRHDKKNSAGNIICALPTALGKCEPNVIVSEDEIRLALKAIAPQS